MALCVLCFSLRYRSDVSSMCLVQWTISTSVLYDVLNYMILVLAL